MSSTFKHYLIGKGRSSNTAESQNKSLCQFLNWTEDQGIESEYATYSEVMSYVKHLQQRGVQSKTVYAHLNALRHYFNWIIFRELRQDNPVRSIEIKGIKRRSLHVIIPRIELERLYESFPVSEEPSTKRNKSMLGLIVWQGLGTRELQALCLQDLQLKTGRIYIAGSRKSAVRELRLEAPQVLDLVEYVRHIRPQLLGDRPTDRLFTSTGNTGASLQNVMAELMKKVRKQHPGIKSLQQVRASVIVHWLKLHNLRQAQYMAGHKYVSTTESYLANQVEDLQKDIEQFHPIG